MRDIQLQNLLGGMVVVAILAWLVWLAWSRSRMNPLLRRLVEVPITTLGRATDGEIVRVVGTIQGTGLRLRAPLTGWRGAWYDTGVYELQGVGDYRGGRTWYWNPVHREQRGFDFFVDDGTAKAKVRSDGLRVLSPMDLDDRLGWFGVPDHRELAFLQRQHIRLTNWWTGQRDLRLVESVLEPGDRVAVVGRLRSGGADKEGRSVCEITALPEGYVLISDQPAALREPDSSRRTA